MYISSEDERSFKHYTILTPQQQSNVVELLWHYYIELSVEEDLPPNILLQLDLNELEKEEAYETCQLYKDTLDYVEQLYNE